MSNIPSLEQFNNETLAEVAPINNNFEALRVAINDNDSRISSLKTETSYNIQNVRTEILNTKTELETELETKANKDLSNVDSTVLSKKITSSIAPNYTASYSVSSGWVATSDGWLSIDGNSSANGTSYLYIDGIEVYKNYQQAGDGRAGTLNITSCCFIGKGQTITTTGQIATIKFIPCKGN